MTVEELQAQVADLSSKLEKSEAEKKVMGADLMKFKAKAKGSDIDPEEFAKLQARVEELTDEKAKADKSAKAEVEKLTKALSEKDGALQQHLVDAAIAEALAKANVAPPYQAALKAMLKQQTSVERTDDGQYKALIAGKPIADHVSEYTATDEGKHFVSAPANTGGGAGGGTQNVNTGEKQPPVTDKAARIKLYEARLANAKE